VKGSGGNHILRNSVSDKVGKWGAQPKGVFAQKTIDSCTKALQKNEHLVKANVCRRWVGAGGCCCIHMKTVFGRATLGCSCLVCSLYTVKTVYEGAFIHTCVVLVFIKGALCA